ncbi:glutathione S-transferase family protein [Piscinibacter sp. XHJ-5]|uniref:glutathione S-transferase family protein n=1 Tax=Piscinibacter sp. XHJ-5 TaxID=3037797 RepID=UPI002452C31B|nr:glutathione S-transferase family protein [Piscinibacter sp. XHJ-5]
METLELVSHPLCPYVQRAAIALAEKGVAFRRTTIDLAAKPDWFIALSPLGKVPLLRTGGEVLFESAAILEYLEDTVAPALHPASPMARARHRGWIEFGSGVLDDIWRFYTAADAEALDERAAVLRRKFERLEEALGEGPYFAGERFSLVDAVFGPVFRYWDVFDRIADFGVFAGLAKVAAWRAALAARPSVRDAVSSDYAARLWQFLRTRDSHLSTRMA